MSSNQDLRTGVREGRFREDLLFRLNAFTIEIPPLRDRGDDAVILARSMLDRLRAEYGRDPARFTPAAEAAVRAHRWDGNVRELFNAVQRAAMLSDGDEIGPSDLGLEPGRAKPLAEARPGGADAGGLVFDFERGRHTADEVEKQLMVQALEHTRGNVSKAARLIGMQRSSFRYRVERYGLERLVEEIAQR